MCFQALQKRACNDGCNMNTHNLNLYGQASHPSWCLFSPVQCTEGVAVFIDFDTCNLSRHTCYSNQHMVYISNKVKTKRENLASGRHKPPCSAIGFV